jgi:hypothetical protein
VPRLLTYEEKLQRYKDSLNKPKRGRGRPKIDGPKKPRKRKTGRKRKKGPKISRWKREQRQKALLIPKPPKPKISVGYKIVITRRGKQVAYKGFYYSVQKAVEAFNNEIEKSKSVKIPIKYTNRRNIIDSKYEILLLKKKFDTDEVEIPKLRNELGILVDHVILNSKWVIFDKAPYNVEEKFWVYGYDPKTDSKDFDWIYQNLLINKLGETSNLIRIMVCYNKLILIDDFDRFSLTICKNISDAIRLYNTIVETAKKDKIRQLIEVADVHRNRDLYNHVLKLIRKLTGWDNQKIRRHANYCL